MGSKVDQSCPIVEIVSRPERNTGRTFSFTRITHSIEI